MPEDPIILSLIGTRRLHAVAVLFATLIFPEPNELRRRHDFFCAFYTELVVAQAEAEPGWATRTQALIPMALLHSRVDMKRAARTLRTRLRDRILAGRMAMPFLQQVETGSLPRGWPSLTISQSLAWAGDQLGIDNTDNVRKRIWVPSQPVLHLGAALARVDFTVRQGAKRPVPLYDSFRDVMFLETWLMLAERLETDLQTSKLQIDPARLHRFRLAEPTREPDA